MSVIHTTHALPSHPELGWPQLLEQLARRCHTEQTRRLCFEDPGPPELVEETLDLVCQAMEMATANGPLPFGDFFALAPALKRMHKEGILGAESLLEIAATLRSIDALRDFLLAHHRRGPALAELAEALQPMQSIWGPIDDCFESDGTLADHASPELHKARAQVQQVHRQLTREMGRLMESPHIAKHLQDKFFTQRENRFVIPVRADSGGAISGIVLGSSSSGATLFLEPREVVGLNNQLKVSQLAVHREEAKILGELSELVAEESAAIATNCEIYLRLDLLNGKARLAHDLGACRPKISDDRTLRLKAARHPLLVLAGTEVVASDIELHPGSGLVISGPNAGGKTVSLKTVGLCALMIRSGIPLPVAPDSEIPLYSQVLAEIGDAQSIERNLSTFTAHVQQLAGFVDRADESTLVLVDEIATGTDPSQGEAIAQALLEALVTRCSQLMVTTHYERLKTLPTRDERFINASVGFDPALMQPTFSLLVGAPGTSFALAVARRQGLASAVVDRAEALLADQERDLAQLLADLAAKRAELDRALEDTTRQQRSAKDTADAYQRRMDELSKKGRRKLESAHGQAVEELKLVRQQLSSVRVRLRKKVTPEEHREADRHVSKVAAVIRQHEPPTAGPATRRVEPDELTPGLRVYLPKLGGEAEVLEPPKRGRVVVALGGIRTTVLAKHVRMLLRQPQMSRKKEPPTPQKKQTERLPQEPSSTEEERSVDNTADLRGKRADDALREMDAFLDRSLLAGRDTVFILHGHGSGALRMAVREHLKRSPMVADQRAGEPKEGGDALTVVHLR